MAQLSNPIHTDWVSQVLHELEELEIQLEIKEIEVVSKDQYKSVIKEALYKKKIKKNGFIEKEARETV